VSADLSSLRIFALAASFYPRVGGGEKYALRYLEGLAERGASVDVLTTVDDREDSTTVGTLHVHYRRAKRLGGFPYYSIAMIDEFAKASGANVIQTFGPAAHDFALAWYVRRTGIPFVAVYHADLKDDKGIGYPVTRAHNYAVLTAARHIVSTNPANSQRLAKRGLSRARIVTVVPGIDRRFYEEHRAINVDLLFVGALDEYHEYKRFDLLLRALALMRKSHDNSTLAVVGSGNRREHFENISRELGIADSVHFYGHVSDDKLPAMYAGARAFILPSPTTQEGFGLVCLEAMAAGAPVVCSRAAGVASLIARTPGCAIWDGTNLDDLVAAIRRARSASAETRREISLGAHAYTWEAMADHLASTIFSELVR